MKQAILLAKQYEQEKTISREYWPYTTKRERKEILPATQSHDWKLINTN